MFRVRSALFLGNVHISSEAVLILFLHLSLIMIEFKTATTEYFFVYLPLSPLCEAVLILGKLSYIF